VRNCAEHRAALPLLGLLLAFTFAPCPLLAAGESTAPEPVREAEVADVIETLRSDPDLAFTREVRTLRWVRDEDDQQSKATNWMDWIRDLFGWFAEVSRVFVWLLLALLVGLLILYLVRFTKAIDRHSRVADHVAPTHVRDLDIRPESLPADVGAAAWALWQRGEHRAALSLLYRGLLSRLAHVHAVPIRDSSTEGECLALAEQSLPAERRSYVGQLIRTWQRAVYGGEDPQAPLMQSLCEQFTAALGAEARSP